MKREYVIPIFVPHLGCSNDYSFCSENSINDKQKMLTTEDIKSTIDYFLKNIKDKNAYKEVAFFGGSFTQLDEKLQEDFLKTVYNYLKVNKIDSIRVASRPNYINKKVLKLFKKYKVKTIELGVQSSNNYILNKIESKYTFEDVKKASKLIRWTGFKLGLQMIVGLPDSTKIDDINTAKALIKLKPKMVRIYPVLVVKGSKLEEEYNNGKFQPITLVQAVETCKELVSLFNKKHINIIRIGLQNTEEITDLGVEASQVVAGPYHPAFRQLVESGLWYDAIVEKIKKLNVKVKEVEVTVNPIDADNVIGHKKENVTKLKDVYDVDLILNQSKDIKQGKSKIEIVKVYNDFLND